MKVEIIKTDGYALLAEVRVGEQILGVMDNFTMIPPTPFSPPSGPAQRLVQGPTPKANS